MEWSDGAGRCCDRPEAPVMEGGPAEGGGNRIRRFPGCGGKGRPSAARNAPSRSLKEHAPILR